MRLRARICAHTWLFRSLIGLACSIHQTHHHDDDDTTRIHAWKQRALATEGRARHIDLRPERNAIVQVARAVAAEAHLLCFDEFQVRFGLFNYWVGVGAAVIVSDTQTPTRPFPSPPQVTDVADALIMASLFHELWAQGVVVLATSNRAPGELYLDGLNRPYFLPFIDLLRRQCLVVDMDSAVDHRRQFRGAVGESYFTPLDGYGGCASVRVRVMAWWLSCAASR